MQRSFFAAIALLLCTVPAWGAGGPCPSSAPAGITSCFFIAASGSDSSAGTSESAPWQHAPGMPNCIGTCASTTPAAGEGFIFRGGDAWHRSASTSDSSDVPMGGEWDWSWSGSSASCNYPTVTSSCIYLGVDTSWYNSTACGSSFCRPQLEMDNPIWANSTRQDSSNPGFVAACTYDDYDTNLVHLSASYLILDNFNVWGKCSATPSVYDEDAEILRSGSYIAVIDSYFHGWTETHNPQSSCCMDDAVILPGSGGGTDTIAHDVFDGSDAHCAGDNDCYGGAIVNNNDDAEYFYDNVCRRMSNCIAAHPYTVSLHDNLFEYVYESYDPSSHGNVFEMQSPPSGAPPLEVYNNVVRHIDEGMTFDLYVGAAGGYFFNNTFFDVGNGGNCVQIENDDMSQARTLYITNNTMDSTTSVCSFRTTPNSGQGWNGTVYFQNNHLIAVSSLSQIEICSSGSTCTWTDNGNEIFQSESAANGQGYTSSNNYQPTSTSAATYHAGGNLSASCSTYGTALCSGSTGGVTNTAGSGVIPIPLIALPPARGSNWDVGAYQFSSGQPNPATGLIAIVK